MAPALGGGTQDTDFNKGFTKGFFTRKLRRRNGGGQRDPEFGSLIHGQAVFHNFVLLVTEDISQVIFGKKFGTRFSQVFGITCISGGHQDLPPGFY